MRRSQAASIQGVLLPPTEPTLASAEFAKQVRIMDAIRGTESGVFYSGLSRINWHSEYQKQYDAVVDALYDSLLAQTRLKQYLDAVELQIDATGIKFTFDAVNTVFDERYALDRKSAVTDLAEFIKTQGQTLIEIGWGLDARDGALQGPTAKLRQWIADNAADPQLAQTLREIGVRYLGGDVRGTSKSDILLGKETGDTITAGEGDDIVDGGSGNDSLQGGNGNDMLRPCGRLNHRLAPTSVRVDRGNCGVYAFL